MTFHDRESLARTMGLRSWFIAFGLTLLVETPVYVLGLRRVFGVRGAGALSVGLNVLTHPIAWTVIMAAREPFPAVFACVEAVVVLVEGLLLRIASQTRIARSSMSLGDAMALSFAANGMSAAIGLLV